MRLQQRSFLWERVTAWLPWLMLPRVWNVLLFTCEAFQDIDSFDGFKTVLADRLLRLGSSKQLDPCPITEANVLSALMSLRCRGIQIRDAVTHLSRTCQFLAGPKTENEFPKQVQYQRSCQGVCCNTFGFKFLQLQNWHCKGAA